MKTDFIITTLIVVFVLFALHAVAKATMVTTVQVNTMIGVNK